MLKTLRTGSSRWLLALVWACRDWAPVAGAAQPVVDVNRMAHEPLSLTPYLSLLEDPDPTLTLVELQ